MHDFWKSYYKFKTPLHALCNVHLLRELVERSENTGQEWPKKMIELLLRIKDAKDEVIASGGDAFPEDQWNSFLSEYNAIVSEGLELNPMPEQIPGKRGRPGKGKTLCLLNRLHDRWNRQRLGQHHFGQPGERHPGFRQRDQRHYQQHN